MENLSTLLKKYQIEIPVIQRDYVQGRHDRKVKGIREQFVEDLLNSIKNENDTIQHLDFIYGRITDDLNTEGHKKNAESVDQLLSILKKYHTSLDISLTGDLPAVNKSTINGLKKKMLPLDGQQRLTTLWLFHFVIAHQKNDMPDWMRNFTYKTRKSSRDFCNKLLDEQDKLIICDSYSEIIENQHWFFYKWKNDPTIKGMLVMLDEIWRQISIDNDWYNNLTTYWHHLVVENKVAFSFLPLNEKNIDDEIYIKMNARGKQLTDFEIFKNQLLDFLEKESADKIFTTDHIKKFAHKLDTKWLDLFWNLKNSDTYNVQSEYFNFIKTFLLYQYILTEKKDNIDNEIIKLFLQSKNDKSRYEDLSFKELAEKSIVTQLGLSEVFQTLNLFEDSSKIEVYSEWLREENYQYDYPLLNENKKVRLLDSHFTSWSQELNYYDRTFMMSIIYYIELYDPSEEKAELNFKRYARVCYNLIYNQNYIQNPDTFILALKSVKKLARLGANIHENFINCEDDDIKFKNLSLTEERNKILLINQKIDYEKEFIKAEKHRYFRGQIGFLIDYSGGQDNFNLEKFIEYRDKLMILFSPDMRATEIRLFERALLSKTNYFINKGHERWMFCDPNNGLRAKEEGWRIVFKKNASEIVSILNNISIKSIEKDLANIIAQYKGDSWRKYFIQSSDLWESCNKRVLKKTDNDYKVRLLKNDNAGGTQREIRTKYCHLFYKKASGESFLPFPAITYHDAKKQDEEPCLYFDNWMFNKKEYFLGIRYFNRSYELNFSHRLNDDNKNINFHSEILSCLVNNSYFKSNKYDYLSYIKNINNDIDLYSHLYQLFASLSAINERT